MRTLLRERFPLPADRRFVTRCAALIVLAAVVAAAAGLSLWHSDSDDADELATVEYAAAAVVTDLMNFAPDDGPERRDEVAGRLTGALAADYLGRGPDVVFTGAVASRITMAATVIDVGVAEWGSGRARALVFVDQTVSLPGDEPERLGVSRWATMVRVDGRWLLARLETVAAVD